MGKGAHRCGWPSSSLRSRHASGVGRICALREAAASQLVSRESALSPAANLVADIADGALLVDFQQGITRGVPSHALQIRIDFDDLLVHVGM